MVIYCYKSHSLDSSKFPAVKILFIAVFKKKKCVSFSASQIPSEKHWICLLGVYLQRLKQAIYQQ